jgi:hypothetical protein
MALNLPRLPQTEPTYPQWQVWWQQVAEAIETQIIGLEDAIAAIAAAQAAADSANAAAASANAAAGVAQTAADDAQATATAITEESALAGSYVTGLTMGATDAGANATITLSAHTRKYPQPDGTTVDVAVNGGSITGRAYDTLYYVYYDDAARAGGAVTYLSTTTEATAAQIGDRHTVGAIRTPVAAAPDTDGSVTRPPGTRAVDLSTL